jgi:hypothetical protein
MTGCSGRLSRERLELEGAAEFARCVGALRPWLGDLVFAGGWAHRLYRDHALARSPAYQPIRTLDADVAFSPERPLSGSLVEALTAAGFEEKLLGEQSPPVTHYALGEEGGGFYVEFLVPLRGSGRKRSGKLDETLSMAGITAQKLRHLELLLEAPWTATVPAQPGHLEDPTEIRVPNAVSFIVQKLLIHAARQPRKRAQDVLYIHDTLELFGPSLEVLHEIWEQQVRPALSRRTAGRAEILGGELFAEVTDTIREAARIPQDRALNPEDIRAACSQGLEVLLDPRG